MDTDDIIPDLVDAYLLSHRADEELLVDPLCLAANEQLATCEAIVARTGRRCQTAPLHGTKFCIWHTEGGARLMGALGGHRRRVYNLAELKPFAPPKSAAEVRDLLGQTMVEVHAGKVECRIATTLAYLAHVFLHTLEITELEPRLRSLEVQLMPERRSDAVVPLLN